MFGNDNYNCDDGDDNEKKDLTKIVCNNWHYAHRTKGNCYQLNQL